MFSKKKSTLFLAFLIALNYCSYSLPLFGPIGNCINGGYEFFFSSKKRMLFTVVFGLILFEWYKQKQKILGGFKITESVKRKISEFNNKGKLDDEPDEKKQVQDPIIFLEKSENDLTSFIHALADKIDADIEVRDLGKDKDDMINNMDHYFENLNKNYFSKKGEKNLLLVISDDNSMEKINRGEANKQGHCEDQKYENIFFIVVTQDRKILDIGLGECCKLEPAENMFTWMFRFCSQKIQTALRDEKTSEMLLYGIIGRGLALENLESSELIKKLGEKVEEVIVKTPQYKQITEEEITEGENLYNSCLLFVSIWQQRLACDLAPEVKGRTSKDLEEVVRNAFNRIKKESEKEELSDSIDEQISFDENEKTPYFSIFMDEIIKQRNKGQRNFQRSQGKING